jgi:glycosyltransferase involved in cell wall biosynthesis
MPSDSPKVVILLATLNGDEYLAEQLQSFRDQSYSNWELLVSDDGSVDRTAEIVKAFAEEVPQRVTLQQGPGEGFWRNFLSLIRNKDTEGEFFAYSDQDDVWFPTKLKKAVGWLASLPDDVPALYFTRTALVGKNGKLLGFSPLFARAEHRRWKHHGLQSCRQIDTGGGAAGYRVDRARLVDLSDGDRSGWHRAIRSVAQRKVQATRT